MQKNPQPEVERAKVEKSEKKPELLPCGTDWSVRYSRSSVGEDTKGPCLNASGRNTSIRTIQHNNINPIQSYSVRHHYRALCRISPYSIYAILLNERGQRRIDCPSPTGPATFFCSPFFVFYSDFLNFSSFQVNFNQLQFIWFPGYLYYYYHHPLLVDGDSRRSTHSSGFSVPRNSPTGSLSLSLSLSFLPSSF